MTALCGLALAIALVPLLSLLWLVVSRGVAGLSWTFFTATPAPVGSRAAAWATPSPGPCTSWSRLRLGVPLGWAPASISPSAGTAAWVTRSASPPRVLSGVPSIVVGIVAYALVVLPMRRFSALAGVWRSRLDVPTLARSRRAGALVPGSLREASLALGSPSGHFPARGAAPALADHDRHPASVARAAGRTRRSSFTSLNNQYWNWRRTSHASLTVQIFNYAVSRIRSGTTGLESRVVLLLLVGSLLSPGRLSRRRFR